MMPRHQLKPRAAEHAFPMYSIHPGLLTRFDLFVAFIYSQDQRSLLALTRTLWSSSSI